MRRNKAFVFITLILFTSLLVFGCSAKVNDSAKPKFLTIGTAAQGGAYYPIGIAMANVITNKLKIQTTAQVTGGAVENNTLVNSKGVDIAITQGPMAYAAVEGLEPYKEKQPGVQALFGGLSKGIFQVVVNEKSAIKSIRDLKGKKVVLGPAGGGAINVTKDVLASYGLTSNDIQALYISYDEGISALTDGNVDAVVVQAAIPSPAITQLTASKKPVRILSIEQNMLAEILKKYPYYSKIEIPKELYGLEPCVTIYLANMVVVNKDLDEKLVYDITKELFENIAEIQNSHPSAKALTIKDAVQGIPIKLHPGAEKYFKEKGVL